MYRLAVQDDEVHHLGGGVGGGVGGVLWHVLHIDTSFLGVPFSPPILEILRDSLIPIVVFLFFLPLY